MEFIFSDYTIIRLFIWRSRSLRLFPLIEKRKINRLRAIIKIIEGFWLSTNEKSSLDFIWEALIKGIDKEKKKQKKKTTILKPNIQQYAWIFD